MAALREVSRSARPLLNSSIVWRTCAIPSFRRCASTEAATSSGPVILDVEAISGLMVPVVDRSSANIVSPRKRASQRTNELPRSRYRYHPPKYNRGPLHPIQPPPASDPVSREFVPGPFNFPRLKQTYHSTINADLLTLMYQHKIPGTPDAPEKVRLRPWDGDSPYMENRARRGPRGSDVLFPLEKSINYNNIPKLVAVHVSMYAPKARKNHDHLRVVRSVLQNITGVRPTVTTNVKSVSQWSVIRGDRTGAKVTMRNDAAWEFLDKVIHLVFPKIKEWKGVPGTSGDGTGNIQFGLEDAHMLYFPEVEANYSMYPAKMIPGCEVSIETSAKSNRHARLLLMALGVPFDGKFKN